MQFIWLTYLKGKVRFSSSLSAKNECLWIKKNCFKIKYTHSTPNKRERYSREPRLSDTLFVPLKNIN